MFVNMPYEATCMVILICLLICPGILNSVTNTLTCMPTNWIQELRISLLICPGDPNSATIFFPVFL